MDGASILFPRSFSFLRNVCTTVNSGCIRIAEIALFADSIIFPAADGLVASAAGLNLGCDYKN